MRIRCPECGFERELNAAQVPDSAVMATCPQCRHRFRFREHVAPADKPKQTSLESGPVQAERPHPPTAQDLSRTPPRLPNELEEDDPLPPGAITPAQSKNSRPKPLQADQEPSGKKSSTELSSTKDAKQKDERSLSPATGEPEPNASESGRPEEDRRSLFTGSGTSDIAWEMEPLNRMPVALYHTILQVLFAAPAFFTRVGASRASLLRPGMFYVLIGTLQSVVQHFWLLARLNELASIQDPKLQASLDAMTQSLSLPMLLISMPPILLILLVLYAGMFNLMIRLVQPDRANFSITLRVVAYSAAPGILCIVPVVGAYAASIWFAFCCFVGCKHALDIPWKHTAIALLPLYALSLAFSLHLNKMLAGVMQ